MSEFGIGDTVKHKSGGPTMVVTSTDHHIVTGEPAVGARWWDGKDFVVRSFKPEELVLV